MDPVNRAIEDVLMFKEMDNEGAREYIVEYEERIKELLKIGKISEEKAWDAFFCLLHECDERGLLEDRRRILQLINTKKYDPFKSKDPAIRFLAALRARAMGLMKQENN